jgi:hypothetical protein
VDAAVPGLDQDGGHCAQPAQEATLLDYLHEVEHMAERIERLERAIDEAVQTAPAPMRAVIDALQALRGIALVSAVTIVAEVASVVWYRRATLRFSAPSAHASTRRARNDNDRLTRARFVSRSNACRSSSVSTNVAFLGRPVFGMPL